MRQELKQTEIGDIPFDWKIVSLGQIAQRIKDKNNGAEHEILTISAKTGFVRQADRYSRYMAGKSVENYTLLKRGAFSYNKGNSLTYPFGCIYRLDDYAQALVPNVYISFNLNKTVDSDFFKHLFLEGTFIGRLKKYITSGVRGNGLLNVNSEDFFSLELALPPLPEQQKIAEILSIMDEKIAVIDEQLSQTQELKKGLMQHLLTKGIGHTTFKNSKLGEIAESWEILTFNDLVKFSGGAQPPRNTFVFEPQEGYIRLVQTRDYRTDKYKTYIPNSLARKKCTKDDIMIGRYGPPIFQILRGLEGAYNVALIKAIPNENKILREYLFYYISQYEVWAFVENLSQRGGGQTGVDLDELKKYPFPLPSFAEQKQIIKILTTVDDKIQILTDKKAQYQELKRGLMQQLLTGQRRVGVAAELVTA